MTSAEQRIEQLEKDLATVTELADAAIDTLIKVYSHAEIDGAKDEAVARWLSSLLSSGALERRGFARPETNDLAEAMRRPLVVWIQALQQRPYLQSCAGKLCGQSGRVCATRVSGLPPAKS